MIQNLITQTKPIDNGPIKNHRFSLLLIVPLLALAMGVVFSFAGSHKVFAFNPGTDIPVTYKSSIYSYDTSPSSSCVSGAPEQEWVDSWPSLAGAPADTATVQVDSGQAVGLQVNSLIFLCHTIANVNGTTYPGLPNDGTPALGKAPNPGYASYTYVNNITTTVGSLSDVPAGQTIVAPYLGYTRYWPGNTLGFTYSATGPTGTYNVPVTSDDIPVNDWGVLANCATTGGPTYHNVECSQCVGPGQQIFVGHPYFTSYTNGLQCAHQYQSLDFQLTVLPPVPNFTSVSGRDYDSSTGAGLANQPVTSCLGGEPAYNPSGQANYITDMATTPDGDGYWLVGADGGVFSFGDANFYGSLPGWWGGSDPYGLGKSVEITGIASTPDGGGYWLVGNDGDVYTFGDASYHGNAPPHIGNIQGIASDASGGGYWLVGSDGGVFSMGDAPFFGSMYSIRNPNPYGSGFLFITGIGATVDGGGYWLVGDDGDVYTFGDAPYYGNTGGGTLNGIAHASFGNGYYFVNGNGQVNGAGPGAFVFKTDGNGDYTFPIADYTGYCVRIPSPGPGYTGPILDSDYIPYADGWGGTNSYECQYSAVFAPLPGGCPNVDMDHDTNLNFGYGLPTDSCNSAAVVGSATVGVPVTIGVGFSYASFPGGANGTMEVYVTYPDGTVTAIPVGYSNSASSGTVNGNATFTPTEGGTYYVYWTVPGPPALTCYGSAGAPGQPFQALTEPYYSVSGGDIEAGSTFGTAACEDPSNNDGIIGYNTNSGSYAGAGGNLAAEALDQITGYATAQGDANNSPPTGLSFANTVHNSPPGSNNGGFFNYASCAPTIDPTGATTPATFSHIINLSGYGSGKYIYNAAAGGTDNVSLVGPVTLSAGTHIELYIYDPTQPPNIFIYSNITYSTAGWNSPDSIPSLTVVSEKGNIYISPNVTQLDGTYIAQPDSTGAFGQIFDCVGEMAGGGSLSSPPSSDIGTPDGGYGPGECDNSLTVNGSFIAKQVELERASGTITNPGTAAEQFNYSPEQWLNGINTSAGTYDAVSSLPPVL